MYVCNYAFSVQDLVLESCHVFHPYFIYYVGKLAFSNFQNIEKVETIGNLGTHVKHVKEILRFRCHPSYMAFKPHIQLSSAHADLTANLHVTRYKNTNCL